MQMEKLKTRNCWASENQKQPRIREVSPVGVRLSSGTDLWKRCFSLEWKSERTMDIESGNSAIFVAVYA